MVFQKRQQAEKRQAGHLRRARLASKLEPVRLRPSTPRLAAGTVGYGKKTQGWRLCSVFQIGPDGGGQNSADTSRVVQLSETLGALSLATDLADGQPQGSAMGATVIATGIGGRLGLDRHALTELYWSVLLRFLGCTATAGQLAPAGFGAEQVLNHAFTAGDPYDAADMRRRLDAGLPLDVNPQERSARIKSLAELRDGAYVFVEQHCEQAKALARRLPVPEGVPEIVSLRHSRWDGQAPMHPSSDQLPLNARIMEFATAMELQRRVAGLAGMVDVAKLRSGGQFDRESCQRCLRVLSRLSQDWARINL